MLGIRTLKDHLYINPFTPLTDKLVSLSVPNFYLFCQAQPEQSNCSLFRGNYNYSKCQQIFLLLVVAHKTDTDNIKVQLSSVIWWKIGHNKNQGKWNKIEKAAVPFMSGCKIVAIIAVARNRMYYRKKREKTKEANSMIEDKENKVYKNEEK